MSAKVIGLAGWGGSGKTTLLEGVIPVLRAQGVRVSTIKHAHHEADMVEPDHPRGHREAGARETIVTSGTRWALLHELRGAPEPALAHLLRQLAPVDLVLVEGFKRSRHAKAEIHRIANAKPWLFPDDSTIAGLIHDDPSRATDLPQADLNDHAAAAALLLRLAKPLDETLDRLEAAPEMVR